MGRAGDGTPRRLLPAIAPPGGDHVTHHAGRPGATHRTSRTATGGHRAPDLVADGADSYRVTWYETYRVCLRATHSIRLAEQAVRLQLGVLADELPDIHPAPLTTVYLGERVDHRLDPN